MLPDTYSQMPEAVYDSTGIPADFVKDLNDTLTEIGGLQARIRLPRYFEPFALEGNAGFIHEGSGTSILAFKYPGIVYTAYTAMLNASTFSEQESVLLEKLYLTQYDGKSAIAYVLRYQTELGSGIRFMYFTGDLQNMYYLVASTPEVVSTMVRNVILMSFRTLEY